MNKKFSTFLVGALLAGGSLLSPAFAAGLNNAATAEPQGITLNIQVNTLTKNVESDVYYLIKCDNRDGDQYPSISQSWSLQATKDGVSFEQTFEAITPNNLWKVIPSKTNGKYNGNFQLVNANGQYLAAKKNADGTYVLAADGDLKEFKVSGSTIALTANGQFLTQEGENLVFKTSSEVANFKIKFFEPKAINMNATALNNELKNGFGLQIGFFNSDNEFEEYELQGNAFAGMLKAATSLGNVTTGVQFATLSGDEVFLKNAATGEVVVLLTEKWSKQNTDLFPDDANKGYKFTTMSVKALANQLAKDKELKAAGKDPMIKSYVFQVSAPNSVIQEPLEVAVKLDDNTWAELLVAEVNGQYLLTTATAANEETEKENKLTLSKADYTDAKTYVRFGLNNLANLKGFWGAAWNITRLSDNKTIVPTGVDAEEATAWEEAGHVAYTKPEGQWILNEDFHWKNRETLADAKWDVKDLRKTDQANVYRIGNTKYLIVKAAELGGRHMEYYGDEVLESVVGTNRTYRVTFNNAVTNEPAYIGRNGVGEVILTSDEAAAIPFQAERMWTTDNNVVVDGNDVNANVDVFNIISDYMKWNAKKEKWEAAKDTVSYNRFLLSYEGKYLKNVGGVFQLVELYDKNDDMIYDDASGNKPADVLADAFVLKEKDGDKINIISIDNEDWNKEDRENFTGEAVLNNGKMMYFDFNFGLPKQQQNIYQWVANAQLVLDNNAFAEYRTLAAHDTLEFFRTEYQDEFLYENKEFLGMTVNRIDYNPAIFVDTAYVRNNTARPTYMLAVGVNKTDGTMECPFDPEHNTDEYLAQHPEGCPHAVAVPGSIAARYLVSYTDSVAAHAKELDNKFYFKGTQMTKLGFVPAVHNVDTLTILSTEDQYLVGQDMIVTPVTFAFRIVNQETQDFIIETGRLANESKPHAWNNWYKVSYVKWHNGCPVLTNDIKEAEVFNVRETSNIPTANEEVAVSEVSVVAVDGAVVVKGAAGKAVAISNILGQTIANTVIASDNETIAVPAGIVVVAVEGEEAVKAIVK